MELNEDKNKAIFAEQGIDFQEKIIQALISDHKWSEQMFEIIKPEYFDLQHFQIIVFQYLEFYRKYKSFPSIKLLVSILSDFLKASKNTEYKESIAECLNKIKKNEDLGDLQFIKEKVLSFCKKQAMIIALTESVELTKSGKLEEILKNVQNVVCLGQEISIGHDFTKDREERWAVEFRRPLPTGLKELDDENIFAGGLGIGELGVFAASKGVGKSHWLVQVGAHNLLNGKNVFHYTFELNQNLVGHRYDSWFTGIDSKQIIKRKDEIRKIYTEEIDQKLGKLVIKKYPIGSTTAHTIRAHIHRALLKDEKNKPDLIVVDYADNMRSMEKFDVAQTRFEVKKIYQELRNLGEEFEVPIWTASQLNKIGSEDDIATIEHLAESFGKADDADIIFTFSMNQKKKSVGVGNLFIAKSRAGVDGLKFNVHVDRKCSKFQILSDEDYLVFVREADQKEINKAKDIFFEMKNDKLRKNSKKKIDEDLFLMDGENDNKSINRPWQ